jgi:hypothetical protein
MKYTLNTLFILGLIALACCGIAGCSGASGGPAVPALTADKPDVSHDVDSQRVLWGIWDMRFDPATGTIDIAPSRDTFFHADITPMITPPAATTASL